MHMLLITAIDGSLLKERGIHMQWLTWRATFGFALFVGTFRGGVGGGGGGGGRGRARGCGGAEWRMVRTEIQCLPRRQTQSESSCIALNGNL